MNLDRTLDELRTRLPVPTLPTLESDRSVSRLPADLFETADAVIAIFDAPGVNQSDVQLKVAGQELYVRIDRFRTARPDYEMRLPERSMGADGRVALPAGITVDPAGAEATLTQRGTLRVRIPKAVEDSEESDSADT